MDTQEMIKLYKSGVSMTELSRLYSVDRGTIKRHLIKEGIKIRSRAEQNILTNKKRAKKVKHDYFSNIKVVNQAWLLGFFVADGNVASSKNELRFNLSSVDREILEKIKKEVGIEREIADTITDNGFQFSYLSWTSEQQKRDLVKYGIMPQKTYHPMHLPNFQDKKLVKAFILGLFDGDGSFSVDNNYCRFRICAHRNELLIDIKNFCEAEYGSTSSLSQNNRGLWELSISTRFAVKVLDDLYSLNSLHLARKYAKFLEYKMTTRP